MSFGVAWLAVPALVLGTYPVGRALTRPIAAARTEGGFALALAAGLAVLGHVGLLAGCLGLLRPPALLALLLLANIAGRGSWIELARSRRIPPAVDASTPPALAWIPLLALAPVLLLSIYPSTAFDATMYHLPFARAFAATGRMPFLPDLRFPIFPQLMEVLFAMVFPAGRDVAAQALSLVTTVLSALMVVGWAREEGEPRAGWLAAAAFLGNPIVTYFGATPYVDAGLILFATAAFYSFRRWRATGLLHWAALAGLFAGTGAAVKYLGLFFVAALAVAVFAAAGRDRRARAALCFVVPALAALGPWYLRIFLETGNPVFPFFTRLFGASAWDLGGYQPRLFGPEAAGIEGHAAAVGGLLLRLVTAPFDLIFPRRHFDWHPPFSPVYLVALPAYAVGLLRRGPWRPLLAIAAAYALFAMTLPRDPRYLTPLLPLLSLAAVMLSMDLYRIRRVASGDRMAALAAAALILPSLLYSVRDLRWRGAPPFSREACQMYLARTLPAYPALDFLNRTRDSRYTLYAFGAENMVYFAQGRLLGDHFGPASFGSVAGAGKTPLALWRTLRDLGVDHLLLFTGRPAPVDTEAPEFGRLFHPVYGDRVSRVFELATAEN
jgi:hypothetical protein